MSGDTGASPDGDRAGHEPRQLAGSAVPVAIPSAERLKLDRRIHNQRRALRENWEIVDMRQAGYRGFTLGIIRLASKCADAAGIERDCPGGGTRTLGWRLIELHKLLAQGIEAGTAETERLGPKGESPVGNADVPKPSPQP